MISPTTLPTTLPQQSAAKVLIVGRPNTGKSTLFNRLLQKKISPVTSRAGMTQDWVEEAFVIDDLPLTLIDSAGAELTHEGDLAWHKTRALIEEVALVIFVLDAQTELTAVERDLARCLRGKKVLLVANKGEGLRMLPEPCTQLGFETPLLLSALHGQGIGVLREKIQQALKETLEDTAHAPLSKDSEEKETGEEDKEEPPLFSLALLGRPNSGKSTLANRLLGSERLIVAGTPGTTRNAVRVRWQQGEGYATLVDTAGLRKQGSVRRSAHPIEQASTRDALRALRQASVIALVVEATRPFEKQERLLAARALKAGKPLVLVANKWDMLSNEERKIFSRDLEGMLRRLFPDVQGLPLIMVSALYDKDVSIVFSTAQTLHDLSTRRIPTSQINAWLAEAKTEHPPPQQRGRTNALRYATQTDAAPPRILIHANATLPKVYLRYLTSSLRRKFDWRGVPIVVEVQPREQRNPSTKQSPKSSLSRNASARSSSPRSSSPRGSKVGSKSRHRSRTSDSA